MNQTAIGDAIRNPIGRSDGVLSSMHINNLGAISLRALMKAQYGVDSMPETTENRPPTLRSNV